MAMSTTTTAMNLGAWRDRTNLFISYRQSYTHHPATSTTTRGAKSSTRFNQNGYNDSERAGLMADADLHDGDAVIEMDLLPPRWLDIQDDISATLSNITTKMKKLDQLHAKHVLPGFDDESVKAREEREIEGLTQEITKGFGECQRGIKRIAGMVNSQQSSETDAKMAKNLQISLASRVGEISTTFRKKQAAYLKKLRALDGITSPAFGEGRSGTPVGASSSQYQNPYTDPALIDSNADRSTAQATLSQTAALRQRQMHKQDDTQILQREREIEKIAQGVIDLSNIFQELNSMVIDQGSLLDRIDYNVERTAESVKEAEKELKVATGYQKKSVKRKVILLLVLLVVGMFILLLVKPKSGGGASAPVDQGPGTPPTVPPAQDGGLPPPMPMGRRVDVDGARKPERIRVEWKKRRRRWDVSDEASFWHP